MKIRRRNNGNWCMEHNGVEAPYEVVCHTDDKFTVLDLDDEAGEHPIAHLESRERAEALTSQHFQSN